MVYIIIMIIIYIYMYNNIHIFQDVENLGGAIKKWWICGFKTFWVLGIYPTGKANLEHALTMSTMPTQYNSLLRAFSTG